MGKPEISIAQFDNTLKMIRGAGDSQVAYDVLVDMGFHYPLAYSFFWQNPRLKSDTLYREGVIHGYDRLGIRKDKSIFSLPGCDLFEWLYNNDRDYFEILRQRGPRQFFDGVIDVITFIRDDEISHYALPQKMAV